MKIFSMALIITCSILTGAIIHKNEEAKLEKTQLLISFLQDMKTCMECTLLSTKEIFISLVENPEYKKLGFVEECAAFLKKGWEFPLSYKTAVNNHSLSLTPTCKEIILSLGTKLGTTDLSGQLSYLMLSLEKLKIECEEIREKYKKKENMYLPISVLAGIGIAIVMY